MDLSDTLEATFTSLSRRQGSNITIAPLKRSCILLMSFFLSVTAVDRTLIRYYASPRLYIEPSSPDPLWSALQFTGVSTICAIRDGRK